MKIRGRRFSGGAGALDLITSRREVDVRPSPDMLTALSCSSLGLHAGSAVLSRSAVGGQRSAALFMQEAAAPEGWQAVKEELWTPDKKPDIRIEGGKTLKTFAMPSHAERVQYMLTSPNGRPVKAKVELWIGPNRCVHGEHTSSPSASLSGPSPRTLPLSLAHPDYHSFALTAALRRPAELIYDCMNGLTYPLKSTLQFKKLSPVLKVSTDGTFEFPLETGVFVPSPEESKKVGAICKDMFYSAPMKDRVQGGSTIDNKGGAIRSFNIDPTWEQTQIMVWSADVGKKSFKTNIEILQGPNNAKQHLNLRCGGSTQPYHTVIDTPGSGWMIRCNSKKYLEDGLFEIAVAPYGETAEYDPSKDVVMGGISGAGTW